MAERRSSMPGLLDASRGCCCSMLSIPVKYFRSMGTHLEHTELTSSTVLSFASNPASACSSFIKSKCIALFVLVRCHESLASCSHYMGARLLLCSMEYGGHTTTLVIDMPVMSGRAAAYQHKVAKGHKL